jgi:hypothetical protein
MKHTKYNSNQKNSEFNWKEYLIANTDLIDGGINNERLALQHWIERGKIEKRPLKTDKFDWSQYIAINQDLIDIGYTTKDLVQEHYINNGYKENRCTVLEGFDWEFYIYYNNHLLHTGINTQSKAIKHWINYGKQEGLIVNINPLKEIYSKIISFNYKNIYNIYDNINNITLYNNYTIDDSILLETNLHYINNRNTPLFKPLDIIYDSNEILKNKQYLLVIDFPCYGGGCSFFINTIISHYKYDTNFLIARNFNGKIYFYINDEKMFKIPFTCDDAIEFIKKANIKKIFFNSIVKHDVNFIDKLFTFGKETTIITHDYSLFFNKSQLFYYEIDSLNTHSRINIHNFDRVITQHIGNLHTFGKNMNDYSNIVVTALPDFRNYERKIIAKNKTLVIGVIGDISDVKGYYVLNELVKVIQGKNAEIVVFGKVHIKEIKKQYSYHTINDLNILLETHKPNLLLELSLWPESYSFTLSLGMITQLPIIYHNKFFPCTVQRRLSLYNNAHKIDNIENITYDFLESKQQDYFYLIKPVIYFPPFWDYYFKNNKSHIEYSLLNQEYNVVIVTSKIYTSNKPFTYSAERSIYSPRERLNQTIETINSIRNNIKNSFIILYDNSILNNDEYYSIVDRVDCFINHHNDNIINDFTNNSVHKLFGEIAQTYKILEYLSIFHKNMNIKNLFKITGRYVINEEFDYNKFNNIDNIVFKRNIDVEDRLYYFTCFYKVSRNKVKLYQDVIFELFEDIKNGSYEHEEWEVLLPNLLYGDFETIDTLGITQRIAVWKDESKI